MAANRVAAIDPPPLSTIRNRRYGNSVSTPEATLAEPSRILSKREADTEFHWKRLKGKNPEGKNFRKLLRRKQSSAKISKISRNTINSSKSEIFYLLRNLLKYLLRTFFSSAKFSEVFALCVFTLWIFPTTVWWHKYRRYAKRLRTQSLAEAISLTSKSWEKIPQVDLGSANIGCTPKGSCNRTLLRRVLRRFSNSKCFLEGFLEGCLVSGFW